MRDAIHSPNTNLEKQISAQASQSAAALVMKGAKFYSRERMLPRLIGADISCLGEPEPAATHRIISALAREGRLLRARAGHWTYDLNRHIAVLQALRAEQAHLAAMGHNKKPPLSPGAA